MARRDCLADSAIDNVGDAAADMAALLTTFAGRFRTAIGDPEKCATTMAHFFHAMAALPEHATVRPLLESAELIRDVAGPLGALIEALGSDSGLAWIRKPVMVEMGSNGRRATMAEVVDFQQEIERIEAVPAIRAATILGVDRKTIYRWIENSKLEMIRRKGKAWISLRSIRARLSERYLGTPEFNIQSDLK